MAEGLFTLMLFSITMAIASFGAGMLPLAISLSQSQVRLMSALGMGVLVGTSFIVIIPEGIDTLYSAKPLTEPPEHSHVRNIIMARSPWKEKESSIRNSISLRRSESTIIEIQAPHNTRETPEQTENHNDAQNPEQSIPPESNPHTYVGISLISGFILMYLIDKIPKHTLSPSSNHTYHIAIDNLNALSSSSGSFDPLDTPSSTTKSVATTAGLVIHAAADGIALGASSISSSLTLEAIIFLAIMLHKAPAAFGLSAVLLRAGLTKRQARGHLIVFSLAAPVGALVTWAIISILGRGTVDRSGMQWWTGILLLFSGGTFVYVAMHTMQDQEESGHDHARGGDGYIARSHKQAPVLRDTVASVIGMFLPLLTQIRHHHH